MKLITGCLLFISSTVFAQDKIDPMINAENNFAEYSVEHGMKAAFLKFLDSSSVVFEKGQPVNGIETWSKRPEAKGILNWKPLYAEISQSGDLGFTSGSWTFQPNSINDSIVARGGFNSIWKKNKNGEWKNIVDLGVSKTPPVDLANIEKVYTEQQRGKNGDLNTLLESERHFTAAFEVSPKLAYEYFLSSKSILNRNGQQPVKGNSSEKTDLINKTPAMIKFNVLGSGISDAGDLGYVYGTITLNGKTSNYLRAWRKEKDGWKIALDVLPY
jgi:hypothetical protein